MSAMTNARIKQHLEKKAQDLQWFLTMIHWKCDFIIFSLLFFYSVFVSSRTMFGAMAISNKSKQKHNHNPNNIGMLNFLFIQKNFQEKKNVIVNCMKLKDEEKKSEWII